MPATPTSSATRRRRGERRAGLLLHPTSLPGRHGVGDLGPGAHAFLAWAAKAGQTLWQMLPVGPTGMGNSPYGCLSAFAGSPLLISPEALAEDGLLDHQQVAWGFAQPSARIDFEAAARERERQLIAAWQTFRSRPRAALAIDFEAFRAAPEQAEWIEDWALFSALKAAHGGRAWTEWEADLAGREFAALAAARRRLADEIDYHAWLQFVFFRQWQALRAAAEEAGVELFGDLPIYLAHDSADVWAHRELFHLGEDGRPTAVAGVPPDYFSATGQLWGNPLYRWERMAGDDFAWWRARLRQNLRSAHLLRLDHFRAFAAYWRVPAGEATAVKGRWVAAPGQALFASLVRELGELPLVAEDLGVITPDVVALREAFDLPGMKVLQFGFGGDSSHAPHRHAARNVVYTGTHDNDTTRGWFDKLAPAEQLRVLDYVGGRPETIARDLVRVAHTSVAEVAVVPVQDLLGLGSEARMNTPSQAAHNWCWRLEAGRLGEALQGWLHDLTALTARLPSTVEPESADGADETRDAAYPAGYPLPV